MEGTEKNEMKVYQVEISEALIRSVPVSAHSEVEAVEKVIGRYKAGQIVLDYEDFTGVDFSVKSVKSEGRKRHGKHCI